MRRLYTSLLIIAILAFITCTSQPDTYTVETIDGVRHVHNLAPLWGEEQKIGLEFVQKIDSFTSDYFFAFTIGSNDNLYILSYDNGSKKQQIEIFDSKDNRLSILDKIKDGPGEFELFHYIRTDNNSNLFLSQSGGPIHYYNNSGEYISTVRFREKTATFRVLNSNFLLINPEYSTDYIEPEYHLLYVVDVNGRIKNEFCIPGKYVETKTEVIGNQIDFSNDDNDNILVSFRYQNRIEKYTPDGTLMLKTDRRLNYEPGFEMLERNVSIPRNRVVRSPKFVNVSQGIGIDNKKRIWNLHYMHQPLDNEINAFNYLEFEVFSDDGILLTVVPLPEIDFDGFQQSGDKIYFKDLSKEMCIYEYRIVEK
ncbi:hypothetical protein ACFL6G_06005 [candidate division KSB1 bacterium]